MSGAGCGYLSQSFGRIAALRTLGNGWTLLATNTRNRRASMRLSILLLFALILFPRLGFCGEGAGRGIFVSVIQTPPTLSSRQAILDLVTFAKKKNVQVLFVQVYRANKAWFPSKVSDNELYRACLKNVGEDPLALLIREAHASGIEVHAWFNLLSLSANEDAPILKKYGPSILTANKNPKHTLQDYRIDNQYFLEAGDPRVQDTLTTVVAEAVRAYPDLDGVQLDYIRYPDVHPAYGHTEANTRRFNQATHLYQFDEDSPSWKKWKYEQVTNLVRRLVRKARSIHPGIQMSTTGLMPYSRASLESFQDWRFWVQSGLVDFVTLMCYTDNAAAFEKYLENAKTKMNGLGKVNIAVGAYKLLNAPEIFKKQWDACEESSPRSCVVFHYGDLLEQPALADILGGQ